MLALIMPKQKFSRILNAPSKFWIQTKKSCDLYKVT